MKIIDHFLTQEEFEITETEISGVFKTTPIPSDLAPYYDSENYISHHQDSGSLKEKFYKYLQRFNLNYKRNIVLKFIQTGPKILDYGCGAGEFLKFVENDFQTFGFEPNETARKSALKKLNKTKLISDFDDIKNGSIDAITLWHVFEHIENQDEILNLFLQKLKKGGILFIAVPNPDSFDAKHYGKFWAAYDVPRHIFHFTKTGMENLIKSKSENWQLKKIRPLLLDSFYISMLSEKYKKTPLFWLKGSLFGAISNFKASKNYEFSSLIYIIEKK
ncbi:class I SAM-dependent methyltransferase [Halpernia sp.]|uniref:class I SAM-dependent methyltransferase n=1 Tax=Halpernia sp. TaxID=2782209 RepID=UPI003A8D91A1